MLSLDFAKGVISFSDDVSKIFGFVMRRVFYTMFIFLVPTTVFALIHILGVTNRDSESCWNYVNELSVNEVKEIVDDKHEALNDETSKLVESLNEQYKRNRISEMLSDRKIVGKDSSGSDDSDAISPNQVVTEKMKIRLTSFSDYSVGAGYSKSSKKISKNSKGWYVYTDKGKKYLVLAAATKELAKSSSWRSYNPKILFSYYDTIRIQIEGKVYDAIILDSCGACMKYSKSKGVKLDLWTTSESQNFGDWQYMVPYGS